MLLDGKTALVTGASRGIGRAIALRLAAEGASVAINYAGNTAKAEETKAAIEAVGGKAALFQADVSDSAQVERMVAAVTEAFGTIDILVNNAGITRDGLLMRMKEEDFDAVLDTNLKGIFHVTKAVSKLMMKKRAGRIVNMASVVGIMGNAGQTNYAASKAGVMGLTWAESAALADRPITVNAVAPGFIETEMTAAIPFVQREVFRRTNSLNQGGLPVDVAETIAYLCDPASGGVDGQIVRVCGQNLIGA